jgi:glycosyltransferase involved in cell wall biosynthesis
MTSVVIAAHNEAAVIGDLLSALTRNRGNGELDIVVVCNGCQDNTADIARGFGPPVRVVQTDIASKSNALNLGDEVARGFPRIYLDADVLIDGGVITALSNALQGGEFLAAGVSPEINTSGCSIGVKAFYSIKDKLPSAREGIAGSGLYAVSEAGRMRFGNFPAIVSDDLYARLVFTESERTTLPGLHSVVFAAKTVSALLVQRTRSAFGSGQLARLYPELARNNSAHNHKALFGLFKYPYLWFKLAIYIYVTVRSKLRARKLLREAGYVWQREQTSRERGDLSTETA